MLLYFQLVSYGNYRSKMQHLHEVIKLINGAIFNVLPTLLYKTGLRANIIFMDNFVLNYFPCI